MIKGLHVGSVLLALAMVTGGCVTKRTYEQLEAEKNREIAALQSQRQALERQRAELQQQVEKLESERQTLEQNKAWLEQDQVALQTRIGLLGQEKTALEQQKRALEQQKADLERQRTDLERQQADLQRQVSGLERQKEQLLSASKATQSQYDALVRNLTEEVQKGQLQVRQYENMLTVDVAEQLFFDSGRATLKTSGKEVLKKVGDTLKNYEDKVIRIIGHTDNVPIATDRFPSNWELSVARATTVVRYLQEVGIPPERMIASGRAEFAPVASNDDVEGRKKNRRIEITLIDKNLVQATRQTEN